MTVRFLALYETPADPENTAPRKAVGGDTNVVDLNTTIRPKRARIRPDG